MSNFQPLVSVVTPVYNGEKYLDECIESVQAQTYQNLEYVIVNNCSTDRTREIAEKYAQKDERIRIYNNSQLLPIMKNWNHTLFQMSPKSKYCKVVHADDWIFPECLELMVRVAEKYPSVGIVGSYALMGKRVVCGGLTYPSEFVPGRELSRTALRGDIYPFLRPTCLLIRSDLIRTQETFYDESVLHADHQACYEILKDHDFGFVHQVLTFLRQHDDSMTSSVTRPFYQHILSNLQMMKNYGQIFFQPEEYQKEIQHKLDDYYRFLAYSLFRLREREFWRFHRDGIQKAGYRFSVLKLLQAALLEFIMNPTRNAGRVVCSALTRRGCSRAKI
jgi:glycosyltransferase involved in cell wall biosynthesis